MNFQSIVFSHIEQLLYPFNAPLLQSKHMPSFEHSLQCNIVSSQVKHSLNPNNEYLSISHSLQNTAPLLLE